MEGNISKFQVRKLISNEVNGCSFAEIVFNHKFSGRSLLSTHRRKTELNLTIFKLISKQMICPRIPSQKKKLC